MNNSRITDHLIVGLCILIGLGILGYFISQSAVSIKAANRHVTVKGLAEREVRANIAIWPISFSETENELLPLYEKLEKKKSEVIGFLKEYGFSDKDISFNPPVIRDLEAEVHYNNQPSKFRYLAKLTITVHTDSVDKVLNARSKITDLIKAGVAITGNEYENRAQFLYTDLNEIKPEMIEEATKNAREVAEKFARDSGSRLGKIKKASQGVFSITDRDSNTEYLKKVRIVSTIDYYLID